MSREIKFQRIYKSYMSDNDSIEVRTWGVFDNTIQTPPNISGYETMCDRQYTGLKDKNGVEIYEGDIVKVKGSKRMGDYISEVVYKRHGFTLKINNTYLNDDAVLISCVVIGNIHSNPELL